MSQVRESSSVDSISGGAPSRVKQGSPKARGAENRGLEAPLDPTVPLGNTKEAFYVGVDLGTSRTSISCSNGSRHTVPSYVGYCKDVIAERRLGQRVLVGQEALDNRLALDLVRPLRNGIIDTSDARSKEAVRELLTYAIDLCGPLSDLPIHAVIGAPARASVESQKAILAVVDPLVSSAMIVSEPVVEGLLATRRKRFMWGLILARPVLPFPAATGHGIPCPHTWVIARTSLRSDGSDSECW